MATSPQPQKTDFSFDVMGRYVCNGLDEALRTTDTNLRPDARPFDFIVVGGGTFGSVLASHLFSQDKTHAHRILVLEAGQLTLPEHQQNLPMINPGEPWGVPWNSDSPASWNQQFPGLAFTIGGRSLYWGGWSPYFIDSELLPSSWPQSVIDDLTKALSQNGNEPYLDQAARKIGSNTDNDFVNGNTNELTPRQLECAILYVKGFTSKEIGKILKLSPRTVGHYIENIKDKYQCSKKYELISCLLKSNAVRARI